MMFWGIYITLAVCFWPVMYRIAFKAVEGHFGVAYDGDRVLIAIWTLMVCIVWPIIPPIFIVVWVSHRAVSIFRPLLNWLER